MSSANAFRSARLIYKAIDGTEDDEFLLSEALDYQSMIQQNPALPQPASKKGVEEGKKMLEKCLLAVLICLPPPSPDATSAAAVETSTASGNASTQTKKQNSEKPRPTPIGHVILTREPPHLTHHRHSEIGIGLIEGYHGQGYGSEAIEWVLEYGFQRAGLHRISIGAFGWNTRAWALYERLGFVMEGRQRDFWWHEGGWHDCVLLGMLEGEWRERQAEKLRLLSEVVERVVIGGAVEGEQ